MATKQSRKAARSNSAKKAEESLSKIAHVRDMLRNMEKGDFFGMTPEDCSFFIRAGLVEAATTLEEGLVGLKMIASDRNIFTEDRGRG